MSDLHNEILEELMTIDDAGNGQDEAIETIINIVREYDYENHEVLQVWKKDIRADERERCMDAIYKCENLTPAQQYFAIEAIKA